MELISDLIRKRAALVNACTGSSFESAPYEEGPPAGGCAPLGRVTKLRTPVKGAAPPVGGNVTPGQSITLTTTGAKAEQRALRKALAKGLISMDEREEQRDEATSYEDMCNALRNALIAKDASATAVQFPHVYVTNKKAPLTGKVALDSGAVHNDTSAYEEFVLPCARDAGGVTAQIKLVCIDGLDDLLRAAFKGYGTLNKMQSVVFPTAHGTNENMLVCAPTGAGKTDVAMLTVTKVIRDYATVPFSLKSTSPFAVRREDFKIVYIAPMKALAAEITAKFAKRLAPFGIIVKEYTGDMQLTRSQIQETQMIVTTPEKWDVITRKSMGDVDLVQKVCLLIIDEVHLLQDGRGSVIETIVARTLREVEISQRMIRIVGLSATLPNYVDVATFLRVDLHIGMFVFGELFRPVPLEQRFIGVKGRSRSVIAESTNKICFDRCLQYLREGHQVMVFVHSRVETVKSAKAILKEAAVQGVASLLLADDPDGGAALEVRKLLEPTRNRELALLAPSGLAFHHAGMLRSDRSLVEVLFTRGHVRVLVCTATLAWGVNLPAHAVIIKGTQVYDQTKGDFVHLGVLDVLQIFGRAGRPQYETHGVGIIITVHDQLARYINSILSQVPIESQFMQRIADNLNAEVSLGTVATLSEAIFWLKYTYLYVRMRRNPLAYGISTKEYTLDPDLEGRLQKICREACVLLRDSGMISYTEAAASGGTDGFCGSTQIRSRHVGRIASTFYLTRSTVETFGSCKGLQKKVTEDDIINLVSLAGEFDNFRVREDELDELDGLAEGSPVNIKHDTTTFAGKAALLIVAYISRHPLTSFSLLSDLHYVGQNAGRIMRALFEIALSQGWLAATLRCLSICQAFERRVWPMQHPLCQHDRLKVPIAQRLEAKRPAIEDLCIMSRTDLAKLLDDHRAVDLVRSLARSFPRVSLKATLYPTSAQTMRVRVVVAPLNTPSSSSTTAGSELWWLFVYDSITSTILHVGDFTTGGRKRRPSRVIVEGQSHEGGDEEVLDFYLSLPSPHPPNIYIHAIADRWMHAQCKVTCSLANVVMPRPASTALPGATPLQPLAKVPVSALHQRELEAVYSKAFLYFNAVQSQLFHAAYFGSESLLVAAPPGTGKTVIGELAIWSALYSTAFEAKVLHLCPSDSIASWRADSWAGRFNGIRGLHVARLGAGHQMSALLKSAANLVVCAPEELGHLLERADAPVLIQKVALLVIDGVHMIGEANGHMLEGAVTRLLRMRRQGTAYLKGAKVPHLRVVALSASVAPSGDLAAWLGISPEEGVFAFGPEARPLSLEVRIEAFSGRQHASRMAQMNKPIYDAIAKHSPLKPVAILVSSRRQMRLTALSLIAHCAHANAPRRFVHAADELTFEGVLQSVRDRLLRHALSFGIALAHPHLSIKDMATSIELYASGQVSIAIALWSPAFTRSISLPSHMVIIKGTEYFDGDRDALCEYSPGDVMHMVGLAGRQSVDQESKVVLLVRECQKPFYRSLLSQPLSVESSLLSGEGGTAPLASYLNAGICCGAVTSLAQGISLLCDTFMACRLQSNPSYYAHGKAAALIVLQEGRPTEASLEAVHEELVMDSLLLLAGCLCIEDSSEKGWQSIVCTPLGRAVASYQLPLWMAPHLSHSIGPEETFWTLFQTLSSCIALPSSLYARHGGEGSKDGDDAICRLAEGPLREHLTHCLGPALMSSSMIDWSDCQMRVLVLLFARLCRKERSSGATILAERLTGAEEVLESALKVVGAMTDIALARSFFESALLVIAIGQCLAEGVMPLDADLHPSLSGKVARPSAPAQAKRYSTKGTGPSGSSRDGSGTSAGSSGHPEGLPPPIRMTASIASCDGAEAANGSHPAATRKLVVSLSDQRPLPDGRGNIALQQSASKSLTECASWRLILVDERRGGEEARLLSHVRITAPLGKRGERQLTFLLPPLEEGAKVRLHLLSEHSHGLDALHEISIPPPPGKAHVRSHS